MQNLIDLLPTEPGPVWIILFFAAVAVTVGVIALCRWCLDEAPPVLSFASCAVVVVDAIANTILLVRARDVYWNDSWVSVALVLLLVLVVSGIVILATVKDGDVDDPVLLPAAVGAGVSSLGVLSWVVGHVIDTADRALKSGLGIGLGTLIVLVVLAGLYFWSQADR